MALQIIDRAAWGARYGDGDGPAPLPATAGVYLHHSATVAPDLVPPFDDDDQAVRQLEAIGQQRFGCGISYTLVITPSGRTYEGHSIGRRGTHTRGLNSTARAIVLVGNYARGRVTDDQVESCAQVLVDGWRRGWWPAPELAGGHRDAPDAATECPGDYAAAAIPVINDRARQLAALDQEEDPMPVTISEDDAELIAQKVWAKQFRETDAAGIKLPAMSAGTRLDAIHRLGALGKLRDGELRKTLTELGARDVADLIDVELIPELLTELGRRLYAAPPPAAAAESVPAAFVAADLAADELRAHDPAVDGPPVEHADAYSEPVESYGQPIGARLTF
jgi:hypothetical protein